MVIFGRHLNTSGKTIRWDSVERTRPILFWRQRHFVKTIDCMNYSRRSCLNWLLRILPPSGRGSSMNWHRSNESSVRLLRAAKTSR